MDMFSKTGRLPTRGDRATSLMIRKCRQPIWAVWRDVWRKDRVAMLKYITAALLWLGCGSTIAGPAEATTLRVIYTAASDVLPLFVAKEEGLFEKEGLDVTLTRTTVTPHIVPVLISGEAEIGTSTVPHLLQGSE